MSIVVRIHGHLFLQKNKLTHLDELRVIEVGGNIYVNENPLERLNDELDVHLIIGRLILDENEDTYVQLPNNRLYMEPDLYVKLKKNLCATLN
jgi:hypothetical protein